MKQIGPSDYLCHGLACNEHAKCARYAEVEGAIDHVWWLATCLEAETGNYPEFVQVAEKTEVPA